MIRIRQLKIPVEKYNENTLRKYIAQKVNILEQDIKEITIIKQSLDARKKPNLYYVFEVDIISTKETKILKNNKHNEDIFLSIKEEYQPPKKGNIKLNKRPIIVGSGPAGLFCAYLLAEQGYQPIIIERGENICLKKY